MSKEFAGVVLEEARTIYGYRADRLDRIDARATTLQATVGIATALLLAAAALILDPKRVHSPWQEVLAVVLFLLVVCLILTGWVAAAITLKSYPREPTNKDPLKRLREGPTPLIGRDDRAAENYGEHLRLQAVDLLTAADYLASIDEVRTDALKVARNWYCIALGLVVILALLLMVYAIVA